MSYNIRRTITTNSVHETEASSSKLAIDCICRPMTETEIREAAHVDAGADRVEVLIFDPTTGERIWDGTVVDGDASGLLKARVKARLAIWEAYKVLSTTGNPVHIEAANEIARVRGWAVLKAPEYPSEFLMTYAEQAERLAAAFSAVVRRDLGAHLPEIVRRNGTEEYAGACATHDFCDANMLMEEAFRDEFGYAPGDDGCRDGLGEDGKRHDAARRLWNHAWTLARQRRFAKKAAHTLADLMDQFSANVFVLCDAGSGAAYGERGRVVEYGASAAERYGAVEMVELDEPVISTDGVECAYESEWIDETPVGADGYRGQPYRVRLLF